jgi:hypothetical protein
VIDAEKAIPWVERRKKLPLAESQKEAVRVALVSRVRVITGGTGVGKTTIVNSILKILLAKTIQIALCAPTAPRLRIRQMCGALRWISAASNGPAFEFSISQPSSAESRIEQRVDGGLQVLDVAAHSAVPIFRPTAGRLEMSWPRREGIEFAIIFGGADRI